MDNNKMITYRESFISKIKKFFVNFFGIEKQDIKSIATSTEIQEDNKEAKKENTFLEDIKVSDSDVNIEYKKKKFLKEIDGNLVELEMLSIDRLKRLEQYYNGIIEQNNEKIRKLKVML